MNSWQLDDLLDEESRRLPAGESAWRGSARNPEVLTLAPLIELAREIGFLFVPVRLRPAFRMALYEGLMAAAQQRDAQQGLVILADSTRPSAALLPVQVWDRVNDLAEYAGHEWSEITEGDRRWVVGAAAALSVAGILAYVLHQRGRPAASA